MNSHESKPSRKLQTSQEEYTSHMINKIQHKKSNIKNVGIKIIYFKWLKITEFRPNILNHIMTKLEIKTFPTSYLYAGIQTSGLLDVVNKTNI